MRVVLLLAAMAACLALAGADPLPRPGLCISTTADVSPLNCDVALNGVVQGGWLDGTQRLAGSAVPSFYVSLDSASIGDTDPFQAVHLDYSIEDESEPATWSLTSEDGVAQTADFGLQPLTANGSLSCRADGWGQFSVTVSMDPWAPVVVLFSKQCVYPRLDVGTTLGDDNVVSASQAVATFAPMVFTSHSAQQITFSVTLEDVQADPALTTQPFQLVMDSRDPTVATVQPPQDEDWTGVAQQGDVDAPITAVVTCLADDADVQEVELFGTMTFGWSEPLVFTFKYRCGVQSGATGVSVGTAQGAADVAANGVAVGLWNSTRQFGPNQIYSLELFLQADRPGQPALPYTATVLAEQPAVFTLTLVSGASGSLSDQSTRLTATLLCVDSGAAHGLVTLDFGPSIDPLQLTFKQACLPPKFNVGDEPHANNIIAGGVMSGWVGVAGPDMGVANLYISLDASSPVVANLFALTAVTYDNSVMLPALLPPHGEASRDPAAEVQAQVRFNCQPCAAAVDSLVEVEVNWGWQQVGMVRFNKTCVVAPENVKRCSGGGGGGGGGGMSGPGVAALVIFLLVLCGCVAGCVINKFSQRKSGWSIVPGYDWAAAKLDSLRSGGRRERWTPQEDAAQGGYGSSASYGAYQNDL